MRLRNRMPIGLPRLLGMTLGAAAGLALSGWAVQSLRPPEQTPIPILTGCSDARQPIPVLTNHTASDRFGGVWKNPKDTAALSLNFSPYYLPGSDPEEGSPVSEEAMRRALDGIIPFTDTIRTFGVSGELNKLYKIAREGYGLRIIAGCWISGQSEEEILEELKILADLGNENLADILVVGSEGLMRGDYDAETLIGWVDYLRGALTRDAPVGVSDTAGALLDNPNVLQAVDVALFTYYPYFNGVSIEGASADFDRIYRRMQKAAGQTKLICSETGWKFEGSNTNPETAARYFNEILAYSRRENLEICYFQALEEKWKLKYDDAGWGLLDENLNPRPSVSEALDRIAEQIKEAVP